MRKQSTEDAFLYDAEDLRTIASDVIIKRGVAYFRENRVTELDWDHSHVWALVEGSQPDQYYSVELSRDLDEELCVNCDCPFDWEPVCKHAVAVLLAYSADRHEQSEILAGAQVSAIVERAQRGRTEVRVELLAGDRRFGIWKAAALTTSFSVTTRFAMPSEFPSTQQTSCAGSRYIVNYEPVLRDLSVISEILKPDLLILDKAQRIKNWRTQIATCIKLISSRYAFVLTGTPLENRLEDLYGLLQVVDHRVLGPLWRYLVDFHVTDDRGKVLGYRNLSELRRRLAPGAPTPTGAPLAGNDSVSESALADGIADDNESKREQDAEDTDDVRQCIVDIQQVYGSRIEQILGLGGGLVVVIDRVHEEDEERVGELSDTVPIALLEPRALAGLRRLGTGSPLQEMTSHFVASHDEPTVQINPLKRIAREKLKAAEALLEQESGNETVALALLASSMVSVVAAAADRDDIPRPDELAVWVYSDALPKGQLTTDEATMLLRASALGQSSSVPPDLLGDVLADARQFVQQFSAGT